jgi:hypothetical protein
MLVASVSLLLTASVAVQMFQKVGTKVPVQARFSTVLHPRGSPESLRDVRGFTVRFQTDQGNWDLVGAPACRRPACACLPACLLACCLLSRLLHLCCWVEAAVLVALWQCTGNCTRGRCCAACMAISFRYTGRASSCRTATMHHLARAGVATVQRHVQATTCPCSSCAMATSLSTWCTHSSPTP